MQTAVSALSQAELSHVIDVLSEAFELAPRIGEADPG